MGRIIFLHFEHYDDFKAKDYHFVTEKIEHVQLFEYLTDENQRYTNADLKISLYILIHIKIIP